VGKGIRIGSAGRGRNQGEGGSRTQDGRVIEKLGPRGRMRDSARNNAQRGKKEGDRRRGDNESVAHWERPGVSFDVERDGVGRGGVKTARGKSILG